MNKKTVLSTLLAACVLLSGCSIAEYPATSQSEGSSLSDLSESPSENDGESDRKQNEPETNTSAESAADESGTEYSSGDDTSEALPEYITNSSGEQMYLGYVWPSGDATSSEFKEYDDITEISYANLSYGEELKTLQINGKDRIEFQNSSPFYGGKVFANDKMVVLRTTATNEEGNFAWYFMCYNSAGTGFLPTISNDREFSYVDGTHLCIDENNWFDLATGEWYENGELLETKEGKTFIESSNSCSYVPLY